MRATRCANLHGDADFADGHTAEAEGQRHSGAICCGSIRCDGPAGALIGRLEAAKPVCRFCLREREGIRRRRAENLFLRANVSKDWVLTRVQVKITFLKPDGSSKSSATVAGCSRRLLYRHDYAGLFATFRARSR